MELAMTLNKRSKLSNGFQLFIINNEQFFIENIRSVKCDHTKVPYKYCNVYFRLDEDNYILLNDIIAKNTGWKISKRKDYNGLYENCLYTSGYGFFFTDYVEDFLSREYEYIITKINETEIDLGSRKLII